MLVGNSQTHVYSVVIIKSPFLRSVPDDCRHWIWELGCRAVGWALSPPPGPHNLYDKCMSQVHSRTVNPPENAQPADDGLSQDGPWGTVLLLLKCSHCSNTAGIPLLERASRSQSLYGFSFWDG